MKLNYLKFSLIFLLSIGAILDIRSNAYSEDRQDVLEIYYINLSTVGYTDSFTALDVKLSPDCIFSFAKDSHEGMLVELLTNNSIEGSFDKNHVKIIIRGLNNLDVLIDSYGGVIRAHQKDDFIDEVSYIDETNAYLTEKSYIELVILLLNSEKKYDCGNWDRNPYFHGQEDTVLDRNFYPYNKYNRAVLE